MGRTLSLMGLAALVSTAACSILTEVERPAPPGAGGAGGAGGGDGGEGGTAGGGGGSDVLGAWSAEAPDEATGTYELPGWLVLRSPSIGKTVQAGANRVRTGFGPNAARARSVDGGTWGLNVESERKNRLHNARIAQPPWQVFNGVLAAAPGPDGQDLAARITDSSVNQSTAVIEPITEEVGAVVTLSTWVTTEDAQAFLECNACAPPSSLAIQPMLDWHRVSLVTTEEAGTAFVRVRPAGPNVGAMGSSTFDLVAMETGRYPSSTILTSGLPATRQAEELYVTASEMAPGGWIRVVMVVAPNYASGEQDRDHDLLFFDAQNRLYVRASDSAMVLQAEGADVLTTPALIWKRDQALTVELTSTESGRTLRVEGADGGDVSESDPTAGAFPIAGRLRLLGNANGSQECADLRSILFRNPM